MSRKVIRYDQHIKLEWLESTAQLVAEGLDSVELKSRLDLLLEGKLSDKGQRSVRSKAETVLMRVWSRVPSHVIELRDEGLQLLASRSGQLRVAVHWGMSAAGYTYFGDVAGVTGRLLRLQDTVSAPQIRRRMVESYGDRTTLYNALRRMMRTYVDWGVLSDTEHRGVYVGGPKIDLTADKRLQSWLIEALLISTGHEMRPFDSLAGGLALFPFAMDIMPHDLRSSRRLEIFQQGLNQDYVMFKEDCDKG